MELLQIINQQKEKLQTILDRTELALGEISFNNNDCQVLSQSAVRFEVMADVPEHKKQVEYVLEIDGEDIIPLVSGEPSGWDRYSYACLLQVENELHVLDPKEPVEHKNTPAREWSNEYWPNAGRKLIKPITGIQMGAKYLR
jgi:hypothetical protein